MKNTFFTNRSTGKNDHKIAIARCALFFGIVILLFPHLAYTQDHSSLDGLIKAINEKQATVNLSSNSKIPKVGTQVSISKLLPGTKIEAKVASGKVLKLKGRTAIISLESGLEKVRIGQHVRFEQTTKKSPQPHGSPSTGTQRGPRPLPGPASLGALIGNLTPSDARKRGLPTHDGTIINLVLPNSSAEEAGFKVEDVILEIENTKIKDSKSLATEIGKFKSGMQARFVFHRNGRLWETDAVLKDPPANSGLTLYRLAEQGAHWAQVEIGKRYLEGIGTKKDETKAFRWYKAAADQGNRDAQAVLGQFYDVGSEVEQNFDKALELYKQSAAAGSSAGYYYLALMYSNGKGVEADDQTAFEWFKKSAEENYLEAQYRLGKCYSLGTGCETDLYRAFEMFQLASERGLRDAQSELGYCYETGSGTSVDLQQSRKWYEAAAEKGDMVAQSNLGLLYWNGKGVEKDVVKAAEWFHLSAEQGYARAQHNLAQLYLDGKNPNFEKGMPLLKKAAEQGFADSQNSMGRSYTLGFGVEKDDAQAGHWFHKAAAQGHSEAQYSLAWMIEKGVGYERDEKTAILWYKKAAIQGVLQATHQMALLYQEGRGVPVNNPKALALYREAAEKGLALSQLSLGLCYAQGTTGVNRNYNEAFKWIKKAAEQNLPNGLYNLGVMYEHGYGVSKNRVKAASFYIQASDLGHSGASEAIKKLNNQ